MKTEDIYKGAPQ